jgi:hypothetical protein
MQCSGLTWALIGHDQALRASLTVPARTPLRPGLSPSCSPEQYETLSTRRLADLATDWQRRNFLEAEDESTLRIAPRNSVSLPGSLLVSVQVIIVLVQCHAASVTGCERNF